MTNNKVKFIWGLIGNYFLCIEIWDELHIYYSKILKYAYYSQILPQLIRIVKPYKQEEKKNENLKYRHSC